MGATAKPPSWTVTLVCGASGVGKSSVAIPLARQYGTSLAEVDDIVMALKANAGKLSVPAGHAGVGSRTSMVYSTVVDTG